MIISPRAKYVTNILRYDKGRFINVDDVALYRRGTNIMPHEKVPYWNRSEDSDDPPPPKLQSFTIVPAMTAASDKGFAVYGNFLNNTETVHAWKAFDRSAETSGSFGTPTSSMMGDNKYAWGIVSFPEAQWVKSFVLQFEYCYSSFFLAIDGMSGNEAWTRLFETKVTNPVNNGYYGIVTTPMECTAVRLLTDGNSLVRSCQFFEAEPLVPVTLSANTGDNVILASEPVNYNLYQCFTQQSTAFSHGTARWYFNGGEKRSNRGLVSTKDQNRFFVEFAEPKSVCGFSVGGITNYYSGYCYANCMLIEGRKSATDYWQPLGEIEFDPAEKRTEYFDFAENRTIKELRITVQDITYPANVSANSSIYLPSMQVWGEE
jgi:hypothetical protein